MAGFRHHPKTWLIAFVAGAIRGEAAAAIIACQFGYHTKTVLDSDLLGNNKPWFVKPDIQIHS